MYQLPVIAIVGRPNVGKSTLFNAFTRSRDALVANKPGLTRDRQYGVGKLGPCRYMAIDTGGMNDDEDTLTNLITEQAIEAVKEADHILFMVDGRQGISSLDQIIGEKLRTFDTPISLVINKTEGFEPDIISAEFQALGFPNWYTISASHRRGLHSLMDEVLDPWADIEEPPRVEHDPDKQNIRVAIIGRPNVGKSTLVNRILGEERQLTFDKPGTTRDSVEIPFQRDGQDYTLIDTAGVRRRSKVNETVEKFSVIKSLQAIEGSNLVLMIFDAQEGVTDQDAHILGYALDSGRALVLAVNKWDDLSHDQRDSVKRSIEHKLHFIDFAKPNFISALHGSGVGDLFKHIRKAWESSIRRVTTTELNRLLEDVVDSHPPPLHKGRRAKLRYIHQGGRNPPLFIVHGNQVDLLPAAYERYLINIFRKQLKLVGTPIHFQFNKSKNPYEGRRNKLSPRQMRKRQRLVQFTKRK